MLTIDLKALAENYRLFQKEAGSGCAVAGVVKADAYGLGMEAVIGALESLSCPLYFTATLEEALAVRDVTDKPVAAFNGVQTAEQAESCITRHITPVLNSLHDIALWRDMLTARDVADVPPAMIHFDTGMNRLGLGPDETARLLDDPHILKGLYIRTVMSHFACADEKDHEMTARQYEDFKAIAARFPQAEKSLANSSGLFRNTAYHFDLVRPGMALYGLNPVPEQKSPVRPVARLECPVLQVRNAAKGEAAGYGQDYVVKKDTKLATVAAGYADGLLRALGKGGCLYYKGRPCKIAGRISMDLTVIDLGPDNAARPGDMVEIIGPHQDADDLASAAGTIGYEILTSLGCRYPRRYLPL